MTTLEHDETLGAPDPRDLDQLLLRLSQRRVQLDGLRVEYRSAKRSRVSRLRSLWLALKTSLGLIDAFDAEIGPRKALSTINVTSNESFSRPTTAEPSARSAAHLQVELAVVSERMETNRMRIVALEREVGLLEKELQLRHSHLLALKPALRPNLSLTTIAEDLLLAKEAPSINARSVRDRFAEIAARNPGRPALATIVIPVYEKLDFTLRCLESIAATWSDSVNPKIVVVDDASPDRSVAELVGMIGMDVLCNGSNQGYLRSTNRGAALATTKYVCFLNNDTEVRPGWLDHLVSAAEEDDTIGAVGSKLVYPDGKLQEAGGIIWSDASGWNYGRGDDPTKPEYNYRREVDYCSAASLLIRTDLLVKIGGFDDRYAPAYYEDADLCFEVRKFGYRVVYEPRSEVIHFEGVSSGTDTTTGVKQNQVLNQPKFAKKWASELSVQYLPSADNVAYASSRQRLKTVLIVDSYVPLHDKEAGSNRLFKIVQIFIALDFHVIFLPDNFAPIEPYTGELTALGVEVLYARPGGITREMALANVLHRIDIAWICRPELCENYLPLIREKVDVPIVYDTIDLHFMRERRRAILEETGSSGWRITQDRELAMARASDRVVTVTEIERAELRSLGIEHVAVVPTIHDREKHAGFGYDARTGLIFIGGYNHHPNVDAAVWLCETIMPLVWRKDPSIHVTLLGNQPPDIVKKLGSERVTVTGFIADVRSFFEEARVFVAPLRYGAGMKGKVGQSLSFGLPVITTAIGAEGYDLVDGQNCMIEDDAESFAAAILRLYGDREIWEACATAGDEVIRNLSLVAVGERIAEIMSATLTEKSTVRSGR